MPNISNPAISAMITPGSPVVSTQGVQATLASFPEALLDRCAAFGIKVRALGAREKYQSASPALVRLGVNVDAWPVPPAGLFVVEERTLYLRSATPMTIAHEFGHALDCMLGGGNYLSGQDRAIRSAFANALKFVTPYAATGLDEYFAESVRAYVGINDPASPWPPVTRERLREVDPAMYGIVAGIFEVAA